MPHTDEREQAGGGTVPRNPGGDSHAEFDRELNIRGVIWAGAGLVALTVASFIVAWFVYRGIAGYEQRQNPEPLPMPEAAERALPPGPRLQATPERDLADMLAQEDALLAHYSLVEAGGEYARIPIERAMELALERGLGQGADGGPDGGLPAAMDTADTEGRDAQ
jgi:hypothetical protein